jgi:hydrogenase maturation factor
MKLGQKAMEALKAEITGCLKTGDELVIVGPVALSGTAYLAKKRYQELRGFFSEGFLQDACRLRQVHGVDAETEAQQSRCWQMAVEARASALYALGEGGVLSGLWKMAEASGVGLTADLRRIPIRQETIELCERYDLNPYRLQSKGSLLLGISGGEALVQEFRRMGMEAAVIGQSNSGNDRLLYSGDRARYLERPARDELEKLEE